VLVVQETSFTHDQLEGHLGDHAWFIRIGNPAHKMRSTTNATPHSRVLFAHAANAKRAALLAPPQLSYFRVYALLLVEDSSKRLALVEGE
jgi:hypothetical protein